MAPLERMDDFFNTRAQAYDHHMLDELGLDEFYQEIAAQLALADTAHLLDLGCGTGLELKRLFEKWPGLCVTGIDLSAGMLSLLKEKFPGRHLHLQCGSYFHLPFGENLYDAVLSTYSLHHFTRVQKQALYQKIHRALVPGGMFVLGDYTVKTKEEEESLLAQSIRLTCEAGLENGSCHLDTPFTAETETGLLKDAGFRKVRIARQWENTTIFAASM